MSGPEPRACGNNQCKLPLVKRPNETEYKFSRRMYCGVICKNRSTRADVSKLCTGCGERFSRRPDERSDWFKKRLYCRPGCKTENITTELTPDETRNAMRSALRKLRTSLLDMEW